MSLLARSRGGDHSTLFKRLKRHGSTPLTSRAGQPHQQSGVEGGPTDFSVFIQASTRGNDGGAKPSGTRFTNHHRLKTRLTNTIPIQARWKPPPRAPSSYGKPKNCPQRNKKESLERIRGSENQKPRKSLGNRAGTGFQGTRGVKADPKPDRKAAWGFELDKAPLRKRFLAMKTTNNRETVNKNENPTAKEDQYNNIYWLEYDGTECA